MPMRWRLACGSLFVVFGASACSAILGIGDPTYDAGSGNESASGAESSGESASGNPTGVGSGSGSGSVATSGHPTATTGTTTATGTGASATTGTPGTTGASSGAASGATASAGTTSASGASGTTGASSGSSTAAAQKIGDPCSAAVPCAAGLTCSGLWCTETCASTPMCETNSLGKTNQCLTNTSGSMLCFPGCASAADCSPFTGTNCFLPTGVCALAHGIGDPCTASGGECASGLVCGSVSNDLLAPPTGQSGWCGPRQCTSSAGCAGVETGGLNNRGLANYCVVWDTTTNICAPTCSSDADCSGFSGTVCGNWTSTEGLAATCGPSSNSEACRLDSTVTGCTGSSSGFSCVGTVTPNQVDPSLTCSAGAKGNRGLTLYCCD